MHLRLSRSPLVFWAVATALALATGLAAATFVGRARAQSVRFGPLRPVLVATRRVDLGAKVAPADVAVRPVPASLVPAGALTSASAAVGRTVVVPLLPGLAVVPAHLAPQGLRGLAALLPPGTRAVAVPRDAASVAVQMGDIVDVLATVGPATVGPVKDGPPADGADPTTPGTRAQVLASSVMVVDVGAESATVAVGPVPARDVAYAATQGVVTLVVTGPGPRTAPAPPARPAPGRPRTG